MSNEIDLSKKRLRLGRLAGTIGLALNLLLFALKLYAALASGSISVAADAVNNLSDALSSVFVIIGYVIASKPADAKHPFGHARMEYLCGLFISIIITVLGIEMLRSSVSGLIVGKATAYSARDTIVMAIGIAVKSALALFYRRLGKKIDSKSLLASATDSIGDVLATSAVLVGIVISPVTGARTDGVLGTCIALYIIFLGIKLVLEASGTLLGEAPDENLVHDITAAVSSYNGVLGVHDLVIHSYGAGRLFASVHVETDGTVDAVTTHDMIDRIEADILRELGISLVIHMDPVCLADENSARLRADVTAVVTDVCDKLGVSASIHDFRVVCNERSVNIIFDIAISDSSRVDDGSLSLRIAEKIRALDPRYNPVISIDRDYTTKRFGDEIE